MIKNIDDHIMLRSSGDIQAICAPLQKIDTVYCNFVRRYDDGKEVCLTTDPVWTKMFYVEKLYTKLQADRVYFHLADRMRMVPWSQFSDAPVLQIQSKLFGIGIGVSLVFSHDGYADFFHIGTHNKHRHMIEIYSNFSECLVQFTHYFYDKAKKILEEASQPANLICLPDRRHYKIESDPHLALDFEKIQAFVKESAPKHFLIHRKSGSIYLTKQEVLCLSQLTFGKTAAEIGDTLFISKRTVETHLENVKHKLDMPNGSKKADLIKTVLESGFDLQRLLPSDRV